jgi:hypothetical protein
MTTTTKTQFEIHTTYHPAVGRQKRGHNEFCFVSKCGRWHARQGNFGTMVLTDRVKDALHIVKGKMPEVEAFVVAQA